VETILGSVHDAGTSVTASIDEVDRNYLLSEQVKSAFDNIMEASSVNETKSESMSRVSRDMTRLQELVKRSMEELVAVNTRNSNAIGEIALSAREMRDQVREISRTAQMLTQMAHAEEDLILQLIIE